MKPSTPLASCLLCCLLSPSLAATVTFSANAPLVTCPAASSPPTPTLLSDFTGGEFLLAPTANEGDLCILSRVNRDVTEAASKKVFIPVARSYDGSDWHRVEGRYVSYVAVQCGQSAANGDGYSAGDYLCQLQVPQLNEGNVGYFLTKWEQGTATDTRQAARFLEKATWGAT